MSYLSLEHFLRQIKSPPTILQHAAYPALIGQKGQIGKIFTPIALWLLFFSLKLAKVRKGRKMRLRDFYLCVAINFN